MDEFQGNSPACKGLVGPSPALTKWYFALTPMKFTKKLSDIDTWYDLQNLFFPPVTLQICGFGRCDTPWKIKN